MRGFGGSEKPASGCDLATVPMMVAGCGHSLPDEFVSELTSRQMAYEIVAWRAATDEDDRGGRSPLSGIELGRPP